MIRIIPTRLLVTLLIFSSARSDSDSTSEQITKKITKSTRTTKTTETTVTIPYRCYRTIQPGSLIPGLPDQIVPSHILHPPYVFNNGVELAPKYPLIKNHSEVEAINKSCSIAKSVLDKLQTYIREGITTEQIDTYALELIIRKAAYPSNLQFNRFPKSVTTSINNIVAFGRPDNTRLRIGDIITVDVSVRTLDIFHICFSIKNIRRVVQNNLLRRYLYYNNYHGACADTFLIEKVDFAGQKLVRAARDVTYAAIKCCRPGQSFNTLGRVIEQETHTRGYKVIPCIESHGIGQFFQEYPHIPQFENNHTRSEEIMKPGMVFTIQPAITDGKPDCVNLVEEVDVYKKNWTISTIDGSRTAQFERTVVITNEGYEILGFKSEEKLFF